MARHTVLSSPSLNQPLPPPASKQVWIRQGLTLGQMERQLEWEIAAWWNAGEPYGDRTDIVKSVDWKGPSYETCRAYAQVARRFELSRRLPNLSIHHHQAVQHLPPAKADALLHRAGRVVEETCRPPSVQTLRQWVKIERREAQEIQFAQKTAAASARIGSRLYSVIVADPPWRFETWSDVGLDRAADNHYPTMTLSAICALAVKIPAAPDCVLWLWTTSPMLLNCAAVIQAWGFEYKSNMVWTKPTPGTGHIFRNAHESLLYCTRGNPPAPAPGTQPLSWFNAPRTRHSEKPAYPYEVIEKMFPHQPRIELFARQERRGWDCWGNEVTQAA